MTDAATHRLVIAHDAGLVAVSRFTRARNGTWTCTATTPPVLLDTQPMARTDILGAVLRHPEYGECLRDGSPSMQVILNSVDSGAFPFDRPATPAATLPRTVAIFQEAQRQRATPRARPGTRCHVLSAELNDLQLTTLTAADGHWDAGDHRALGRPLNEVSGQDPVDHVTDLLVTTSGLARAAFTAPLVRTLITRQLSAYQREAATPQYGPVHDVAFVLPPLSPLGHIEFTLPVTTLFPSEGERLRDHLRTLRTALLDGELVLVAGRVAAFEWAWTVIRDELGSRAIRLSSPEFAAVRGGSLGTGDLTIPAEVPTAGTLTITDGVTSRHLPIDLTRNQPQTLNASFRAYTAPSGDLLLTLRFVWTWPTGSGAEQLLSVTSALPRWTPVTAPPAHSGSAQIRTTALEVTADADGTLAVQLTYPFASSRHRWNVTA